MSACRQNDPQVIWLLYVSVALENSKLPVFSAEASCLCSLDFNF
jgi:hypothetical protein